MSIVEAHHGLSTAEVAERLRRSQSNRDLQAGWGDYREIALRNLLTLFNALIVPAAIALFVLGDYRSAWAVSALAFLNVAAALFQEIRAKRHLDRLALLADPKARAIRDGVEKVISASDVVLDDTLALMPGEAVVADGILLATRFLEMDEALMTGESDPVARQVGDRVLSGSVCVAGDGVYCVDKVGKESYVNQTSALARRYQYVPSPMQRTLDTLIRVLTGVAVALCLLYVVLYFLKPFRATDLWEMIAATVTSMVPQGLVLMTTLAFTLGALRMSTRGALVQRLNAVESMAAIDVLCMDKTGTLTTNQLKLERVHVIEGNEDEIRVSLRIFAWTSVDEGSRSIQALRLGLGAATTSATLIEQIPFKSQNRFSAVRVRWTEEEHVLVLGAFEALAPHFASPAGSRAEAIWRELLPTGLRLLLFARETSHRRFDASLLEMTLQPLALVALNDELRPEAGAVLEALSEQGIEVKVLSGDNPETVHATLRNLQLPLARELVSTGAELEAATERLGFIRARSVFGRVTAQQKLEIITTLQRSGKHVAMIGDGVNDILAIKRADLGIAMGAGSGAAKMVAALVLENNSFALVPETLREGRLIVANLRRAAKWFLLKNVYTLVLIVVGTGMLGLVFPYAPQQVTLLNILTIGGPAFLVMLARPAASNNNAARPSGFLSEVGWFALGSGLVVSIGALGVWLFSAWQKGDDAETQRTLLLTCLILMGLANVLIVAEGERPFLGWVAGSMAAYAAVLYLAPLADFFVLTPLSALQWLGVGAVTLAAGPFCYLAGRHAINSRRRSEPSTPFPDRSR